MKASLKRYCPNCYSDERALKYNDRTEMVFCTICFTTSELFELLKREDLPAVPYKYHLGGSQ